MNNCEVLNAFGAYHLESEVYGALSLASRLAANAKNRTNTVRIAYWLFETNRKLTNLLDNIHAILEGKKTAPSDSEPMTKERLRDAVDNIEYLYRTLEYVYESSRRARLTNNSLTAGSLRSIQKHNDELLDLVNWIESLVEAEPIKNIFERAKQERESGDIYDLSQV